MDFLTAALYYDAPGKGSMLRGTLLTQFDADSDVARARVRYVTAEELRQGLGTTVIPAGFTVSEEGILLSDTDCRRVLDEDIAQYASNISAGESPPVGLIDLVLHGAQAGASVVVNYDRWVEGDEPILIPFRNFRVSESSFNIYAPYRNVEDKFRTFSLVNILTDEVPPIHLIVGQEGFSDLACLQSHMTVCADAPVDDGEICYLADVDLLPASSLTGEAFCNYLAFNVAFYKIGLGIIAQFLEEAKYVYPPEAEVEEAPVVKEYKKPKHNISIKCGMHKLYTRKILSLMDDEQALASFLERVPEARITQAWLDNIVYNKRNVKCAPGEGELAASCVNLRVECRRKLLRFSLELLAQRLYLCQLGPFDDPIGPDLRGGGVIGYSVKRATW